MISPTSEMRLVKVGDMHIELLRYMVPAGEPAYTARNCDVGAAHIYFVVDDIVEGTTTSPRSACLRTRRPSSSTRGTYGGCVRVPLDPDGLPVKELIQLPGEAA